MRGSGVVVARISGVQVRVQPGALLLFAAITWLLATRLVPAAAPRVSSWLAWLLAVAGAVLFELGIVLHEVGHAVAARRSGLRSDAVDLQLFGGITEIDGEVSSPRDELVIAGIGPAISLGYAGAIGVLAVLCAEAGAAAAIVTPGAYVALASAAIGLVNLLPGAPLDGGRLLRAWCWHRHGDRRRAALTAVRAGRWVAGLFIAAGIALAATRLIGILGGLSVVALGGTSWFAVREELRQLRGGYTETGTAAARVAAPETPPARS